MSMKSEVFNNQLKRVTVLLSFVLILFGCDSDDGNPFDPDNCVRGNGPLISEVITVDQNFTGIEFGLVGDLLITQGPEIAIRVEAQANVQEVILYRVQNGNLILGFEGCVEDIEEVQVYISMPEIELLSLTGVGDIRGESEIESAELDLRLTGVGNIILEGIAPSLNIRLSGVGDIRTFELLADDCAVNLSGVGDCEVTANNTLDADISGVGSVFYKGDPVITSNITGEGTLIDAN